MTLLEYSPVRKAENQLISLLDRTAKKSLKVKTTNYSRELPRNIRRQFGSKTFEVQMDRILTSIIVGSVTYADSQMNRLAAASVEESHILTEETVKLSTELAKEVIDSVVVMLQEENIYYQHPNTLARHLLDMWKGERYRAVRFARTFTADVATNTTVYRYRQYGVQYMEFDAEIDGVTSDQCRCLDGTVFDMSTDAVDQYRPPLHHHCRSGFRPVPITRSIDQNKLYENRDFSEVLESPEKVDKAFENIDIFNEKYRIDKFILDQDISTRIIADKGLSSQMFT